MLQLALKLNASRKDLSDGESELQDAERFVKEWTQLAEQESKSRRNSVHMVKDAGRKMVKSLSGMPHKKETNGRILHITPERARKEMGELYLQSNVSKSSETFSRPPQPEALWMPVRAMLCRNRFIFSCSTNSDGIRHEEPVLEDIMFHHINSICCADIVEDRPREWAIKLPEKQVHGASSWISGIAFRSNRVQADQSTFYVEDPLSYGPQGKWKSTSSSSSSTHSRFLRLTLCCYGRHRMISCHFRLHAQDHAHTSPLPCKRTPSRAPADLPKSDLFSKSDPMCILTERPEGRGDGWRFVGQTECVLNCQDPRFQTTLDVAHPDAADAAGGRRVLRFTVVDVDESHQVRVPSTLPPPHPPRPAPRHTPALYPRPVS